MTKELKQRTQNKELKLEIITVPGETSCLEYHKDLF